MRCGERHLLLLHSDAALDFVVDEMGIYDTRTLSVCKLAREAFLDSFPTRTRPEPAEGGGSGRDPTARASGCAAIGRPSRRWAWLPPRPLGGGRRGEQNTSRGSVCGQTVDSEESASRHCRFSVNSFSQSQLHFANSTLRCSTKSVVCTSTECCQGAMVIAAR